MNKDYTDLGFIPKPSREINHRKKSEEHNRKEQKQRKFQKKGR